VVDLTGLLAQTLRKRWREALAMPRCSPLLRGVTGTLRTVNKHSKDFPSQARVVISNQQSRGGSQHIRGLAFQGLGGKR